MLKLVQHDKFRFLTIFLISTPLIYIFSRDFYTNCRDVFVSEFLCA